MNKTKIGIMILVSLALVSLGLDFSPEIKSQIEEIQPDQVSPTDTNQSPSNQSETDQQDSKDNETEKVDDWQYEGNNRRHLGRPRTPTKVEKDMSALPIRYSSGLLLGQTHKYMAIPSIVNPVSLVTIIASQSTLTPYSSADSLGSAVQQTEDLGLKTGGAQDVNNFRDNIENDYLPINKDISYEGLFHEYFFKTESEGCKNLFCPSYSKAVTEDPLSGEEEYYTTVGLNSELTEKDFERKDLNLVVVLDISGSMGSSFSEYYYDRFGNKRQVENLTGKSKMEVAKESLRDMTKHLGPDDKFGIVLFNSNSHKAKPMRDVGSTDMDAIRYHIMNNVSEGGGTNMEAGISEATEMLEKYTSSDQSEYENRMVFMTDAMPNIDTTSDEGLTGLAEENAKNNIHTTFVGMGVDFNTELVDSITGIKGANYYSVHSSDQFKQRMDENFDYMVTPLVYDLELKLDSEGYKIEKVYGSTAAEESTGQILKVNTLFPSPRKEGKTKGGVVLAQLEKTGKENQIEAEVSYKNREGEKKEVKETITFSNRKPEYFEDSGVKKAVLLSRYGDLMKNWINYERQNLEKEPVPELPPRYQEDGIEPYKPSPRLGEQERQSEDLQVSEKYRERIKKFKNRFKQQKQELNNQNLQQEIEIMNKILN
jgi:Ca-activated chloride channel family protein